MISSKVLSERQVRLPREISDYLGLREGDLIIYALDKDSVRIRKASSVGPEYLSALESTLEEWNGPDDEQAFRDL